MTTTNDDTIVIWEAPKIVPPEFRLYYDESGKVISYTCDTTTPGNYIIVDRLTFASARYDIRVIDGKISTAPATAVVYKLMPDNHEGVDCAPDDISIVVSESYTGDTTKWKLNIYEL